MLPNFFWFCNKDRLGYCLQDFNDIAYVVSKRQGAHILKLQELFIWSFSKLRKTNVFQQMPNMGLIVKVCVTLIFNVYLYGKMFFKKSLLPYFLGEAIPAHIKVSYLLKGGD